MDFEMSDMQTITAETERAKEFEEAPLSRCLEMGLEDLAEIEGDEAYRVSMGLWHTSVRDLRVCAVCQAGAVMAKTFKVDPRQTLYPAHFSPAVRARLFALEFLRIGDVWGALNTMGQLENLNKSSMLERFWVRAYYSDPSGYKEDMRKLVQLLRDNGF